MTGLAGIVWLALTPLWFPAVPLMVGLPVVLASILLVVRG